MINRNGLWNMKECRRTGTEGTFIHDENMNGKLDANAPGIPKEGYGFSNDVKALFGAPSFSAANFQYNGETLDLTISMHS